MLIDSETFGIVLRQLRRRIGLTQAELGERVGLSGAHISRLEKDQRLPDVDHVAEQVVRALELDHEPRLAAQLIELAAVARGQRPPDPVGDTRTAELVQTAAPVRVMPQPAHALIGREREVTQIVDRLADHGGRLLTLLGPPGVGKTRLAQAVAARLLTRFGDGVCLVSLAGVTQPSQLPTAILATIQEGRASPINIPSRQRLIDVLRRRELLLVLDNFEHIVSGAGLVAELLAECPRLRVLVTSRVPLRLRSEQRVRVEPLALVDAKALFRQRAQEATGDPDYQPDDGMVAAICRRLDCLPLAIELVAARSDLLGVGEILARSETTPLDLVAGAGPDLPARQRTLRHSIRHSYELLAPAEQRLFRMLGVFVGSFGLEAAAAYGVEETALQRLVHVSLVQGRFDQRGRRRFWLLETLREFALEQLEAHGELPDAQRWHAQYCLELAETAEGHRWEAQAADWIAELSEHHDTLHAALDWAAGHGHVELAVRLAVALVWYWESRSATHEVMRWTGRLLDLACDAWAIDQARFGTGDDDQLARRLLWLTLVLKVCPGFEPADYQRAARLRPVYASADLAWPSLGHIQFMVVIGWFEMKRGRYAEMEACARAALDLLERRATPDDREHQSLRGEALDVLATHAFATGQFERCVALGREAESLFVTLGWPMMAGFASLQLGRAALYSGDTDTAWVALRKTLARFKGINDIPAVIITLYEIGTLAARVDQIERAHGLFTEALTLASQHALAFYYPLLLRGLAEVSVRWGQPERAAQLLGAMDHLIEAHSLHVLDVRQADMTRTRAAIMASLDPEGFGAAYAEGYVAKHRVVLEWALA